MNIQIKNLDLVNLRNFFWADWTSSIIFMISNKAGSNLHFIKMEILALIDVLMFAHIILKLISAIVENIINRIIIFLKKVDIIKNLIDHVQFSLIIVLNGSSLLINLQIFELVLTYLLQSESSLLLIWS
jgi:hypothetical protein